MNFEETVSEWILAQKAFKVIKSNTREIEVILKSEIRWIRNIICTVLAEFVDINENLINGINAYAGVLKN